MKWLVLLQYYFMALQKFFTSLQVFLVHLIITYTKRFRILRATLMANVPCLDTQAGSYSSILKKTERSFEENYMGAVVMLVKISSDLNEQCV